jgi:hypothetical protein
VIVTLCAIAASALVNRIRNEAPAGPVSDAGTNSDSRASSWRVTGAGAGPGVGFVVGFGVGLGVGLAVGLAVGGAVAVGRVVATGVDVRLGWRTGASVGSRLGAGDGVTNDAGAAVTVGPIDGVALAEADGTAGDEVWAALGNPGGTEAGAGAAQAVTSSPTAISRRVRARGTAAL